MKKTALYALLMVPAVMMASSGDAESTRYFAQTGRESDFVPRLVNFTIFAALLYYLLANPIKDFFKGRTEGISAQLNEIEEKLKAAKNEEEAAKKNLKDSEKKAAEIIVDAKAEAKLLAEKIALSNSQELEILSKQHDEKVALEERKSVREVIDSVLSDNISTDDITLDETKIVEIISKKVA